MKIAVVGAGGIGANIAYRLQKAGADVVLIDAARPASGTTGASFSWLSSFPQLSWKESPGRASLRLHVHEVFNTLHDELGGDWLDWSGTLTDIRAIPDVERAIELCRQKGARLEVLDAVGLAGLCPGVDLGRDARVVFEPDSGWVDAPALVARLVQGFVELGGKLLVDAQVASFRRNADRVTGLELRDGGHLDTDVVVNAAGSWAVHLSALAGLAFAIDLVPGVMIYAGAGRAGLPRQVLNGSDWLVRPDKEHGLAIHWRGEGLTAVHGGNGSDSRAMLADIARFIPALQGASPSAVRVGIRAVPHGGPIVGALTWLKGFYMAVSHGGIGWGPTWAHIVQREILGGEDVPEIADMRPARFYMEPQAIGKFADDAEQVSTRRR